MNEAIDYEKLADEIAKRMEQQPKPEYVLWDGDRCAEYFHCSRKHFVDVISKKNEFPRPACGSRSTWFASEVCNWAKSKKLRGS